MITSETPSYDDKPENSPEIPPEIIEELRTSPEVQVLVAEFIEDPSAANYAALETQTKQKLESRGLDRKVLLAIILILLLSVTIAVSMFKPNPNRLDAVSAWQESVISGDMRAALPAEIQQQLLSESLTNDLSEAVETHLSNFEARFASDTSDGLQLTSFTEVFPFYGIQENRSPSPNYENLEFRVTITKQDDGTYGIGMELRDVNPSALHSTSIGFQGFPKFAESYSAEDVTEAVSDAMAKVTEYLVNSSEYPLQPGSSFELPNPHTLEMMYEVTDPAIIDAVREDLWSTIPDAESFISGNPIINLIKNTNGDPIRINIGSTGGGQTRTVIGYELQGGGRTSYGAELATEVGGSGQFGNLFFENAATIFTTILEQYGQSG